MYVQFQKTLILKLIEIKNYMVFTKTKRINMLCNSTLTRSLEEQYWKNKLLRKDAKQKELDAPFYKPFVILGFGFLWILTQRP